MNSKKKKVIYIVSIIGAVAALCILTTPTINFEKEPDDLSVNEIVSGEEGRIIDNQGGDPGLTNEDLYSVEYIRPQIKSRDAMVDFLLEYIGYIPYTDGGKYWGDSYPRLESGIDNRQLENKLGMDSLGFVEWIYYHFWGVVIDPVECYKSGNVISIDNLMPGDIGMYSKEGGANHYGIFVGYDESVPVFAHCSSGPAEKYPLGVLRLSGLAPNSPGYYNGWPPVNFIYFTRPDVKWDNNDTVVTEFSEKLHTVKGNDVEIRNQCGDFGERILDLICTEKYDDIYSLLNLSELKKGGYKLDRAIFNSKLCEMTVQFENCSILLYNLDHLTSADAYVARFYIAPYRKVNKEILYDYDMVFWLDMTIYYTKDGSITTFLPFHMAMIAESGKWLGVDKIDK